MEYNWFGLDEKNVDQNNKDEKSDEKDNDSDGDLHHEILEEISTEFFIDISDEEDFVQFCQKNSPQNHQKSDNSQSNGNPINETPSNDDNNVHNTDLSDLAPQNDAGIDKIGELQAGNDFFFEKGAKFTSNLPTNTTTGEISSIEKRHNRFESVTFNIDAFKPLGNNVLKKKDQNDDFFNGNQFFGSNNDNFNSNSTFSDSVSVRSDDSSYNFSNFTYDHYDEPGLDSSGSNNGNNPYNKNNFGSKNEQNNAKNSAKNNFQNNANTSPLLTPTSTKGHNTPNITSSPYPTSQQPPILHSSQKTAPNSEKKPHGFVRRLSQQFEQFEQNSNSQKNLDKKNGQNSDQNSNSISSKDDSSSLNLPLSLPIPIKLTELPPLTEPQILNGVLVYPTTISPLILALKNEHNKDIIQLLLQSNCDVNHPCPHQKNN
jgi:hypothetical protein